MIAAGAAALLAGCADSTRMADPFSNPFGPSAKAYDSAPVGAIKERPKTSAPTSTRIESTPLPAPQSTATQSNATPASQPVAAAPSRASGATIGNWSSEGGTSIVVGQGETANMLATRYGVPTDALLKTNGLSSASQVQPGSHIVVPVYRAGAARTAEAKPAQPKSEPKSETKPEPKTEAKAAAKKEKLKFVKGPDSAKSSRDAKTAAPADDPA